MNPVSESRTIVIANIASAGLRRAATPDTIVVVHKDHGAVLATWQPHRGVFIGVKPTGDTYGPFFHTNLEPGSILKWMKIG